MPRNEVWLYVSTWHPAYHRAVSEWQDKAGPWARATLPDGQQLDVVVTSRTRTPDGVWWYEAEVILPDRRQHTDGRTERAVAPTPITVHADDVTPIPGERYDAVPTVDEHGPAAGWLLVRTTPDEPDAPAWVVHRRDCAQARGSEVRTATDDEAAEAVRDGQAVPCSVCRPERALHG